MSKNKTVIKDPKLNTANANAKDTVDLSRRRFAKAGLIASPILASLPGKSALAGNCTSLSGMLSGNLSAPDGGGGGCGGEIKHAFGLSPGYWRTVCTNTHEFPLGYQVRDFLNIFGYGSETMVYPSTISEYTILEALWLKQSQCDAVQWEINLTRHTIAAFFSSITSSDYFIGPEQILQIYNAVIVGGGTGVYVEPVTGETIDYTDVIYMYNESYKADIGSVVITDNDTFIDCDSYRYDDTKGHLYIRDFSGSDYYRISDNGTKSRMLSGGNIQIWDGMMWYAAP